MNSLTHDIFTVTVISAVTILTRAVPFMLFPGNRKIPKAVTFLSRMLPCAVMGMLIIYCLREVSVASAPHGIPELISSALVSLSYIWKRNTLVSILLGTVFYMLLTQFVFV